MRGERDLEHRGEGRSWSLGPLTLRQILFSLSLSLSFSLLENEIFLVKIKNHEGSLCVQIYSSSFNVLGSVLVSQSSQSFVGDIGREEIDSTREAREVFF